jgi:hypothetical protein
MNTPVEVLAGVTDPIDEALPCAGVAGLDDDGLLDVVRVVEAVGRRVDALRVTVAAEVPNGPGSPSAAPRPVQHAGLARRERPAPTAVTFVPTPSQVPRT